MVSFAALSESVGKNAEKSAWRGNGSPRIVPRGAYAWLDSVRALTVAWTTVASLCIDERIPQTREVCENGLWRQYACGVGNLCEMGCRAEVPCEMGEFDVTRRCHRSTALRGRAWSDGLPCARGEECDGGICQVLGIVTR